MTLAKTVTDPKARQKIVELYTENLFLPASYIFFPVSGKTIVPLSQKNQAWFERVPTINNVITISGYLLQEVLRTFGIYNHANVDLSTLLFEHPIAEIEKREEDIDSEVLYILVKENNNGISIAVILENGTLQQSHHTENYHVVFDDDFSQLQALTHEVRHGEK